MIRLFLIPFMIFLVACQNPETYVREAQNDLPGQHGHNRKRSRNRHAPPESRTFFINGDTVFIPEHSALRTKLTIQTIQAGQNIIPYITTGVVKPLTGRKAEIAAPFEGRIVRSFIKLGQKVNKGTALFEISSSDYMETVRTFIQSSHARELAEKNFLRKKELLETGVSSRKEFDEAKSEFELADKEYEKTAAILKIMNIDPKEADIGKPLIIRSPISGEVVRNDLTVGQYIRSDSDPVLTVADLTRIWVIARVKEKDLGAVSLQDQVEIFTDSHPEKPVKGLVSYIGDIMNEQTRSVEVYIECDNDDHKFKCGMFVTARFSHKRNGSIIVPASAVLQDYDKTYLYIQEGPELFVKREVEVTSVDGNRLMVLSGLENGNIIISEGGMYLR